MNGARLSRSPRLQRVHALLLDGEEHTTREVMDGAHVCAVSACVSELRAEGAEIECRTIRGASGQRLWLYRMTAPVPSVAERSRRT